MTCLSWPPLQPCALWAIGPAIGAPIRVLAPGTLHAIAILVTRTTRRTQYARYPIRNCSHGWPVQPPRRARACLGMLGPSPRVEPSEGLTRERDRACVQGWGVVMLDPTKYASIKDRFQLYWNHSGREEILGYASTRKRARAGVDRWDNKLGGYVTRFRSV